MRDQDRPALLVAMRAHLAEEADFNRSWTDGRRGPKLTSHDSAYCASRISHAEKLERWCAEIDAIAAETIACGEMDDDDMDALITLLGQHERDEIGHQGLVATIVQRFAVLALPGDADA